MEPDKRYQVFVSSTFEDLQDQRKEVVKTLLELDCIPAGMELFPAADDDQWTLIKRVIDICDYYLVVVGGKYGTIGPDGKSYTEMEYEYAVSRGIPVLGFLYRDPDELPAGRCEKTDEGRKRLDNFRTLIKKKHCAFWKNTPELGIAVMRSLIAAKRDNPRVGWVRADRLPEGDVLAEMLRLRKRIDELEAEASTEGGPLAGTEKLAQGDDVFPVHYKFAAYDPSEISWTHWNGQDGFTWDEIFSYVGPKMMSEASEEDLRRGVDSLLSDRVPQSLMKDKRFKGLDIERLRVTDRDFDVLKLQLSALNLIKLKEDPKRSVRDRATYWTLTDYGRRQLLLLNAIRKPETSEMVSSVEESAEEKDPE